jgi:DNA-binding beta-propeller fold protein YncE
MLNEHNQSIHIMFIPCFTLLSAPNIMLSLFNSRSIVGTGMFLLVRFFSAIVCGGVVILTETRALVREETTFSDSMALYSMFTLVVDEPEKEHLQTPAGIVLDNAGNIIVADAGNYRICKVSSKGEIRVVAGGTFGFADGQGAQAQFFNPIDVALAADGCIIVVDGNRVRKITAEGLVTTIAGHSRGYADGAAATALFNIPVALATDKQGNIFVADAGNNRIRKISANGIVSTLNTTSFLPMSIAVDDAGSVITIDHTNACVRKFQATATGAIIDTVLFRYASEAHLTSLTHLALDGKGNMIVLDHSGECIRKITPSGNMITLLAKPSKQGKTTAAVQQAPSFRAGDIAVDTRGNLFITDLTNNSIRKISIP